VDTFFVTVLGLPVLTGLRHRASCFLLAGRVLPSLVIALHGPGVAHVLLLEHAGITISFIILLYSHFSSLYFTLCALSSSYFFFSHLSFLLISGLIYISFISYASFVHLFTVELFHPHRIHGSLFAMILFS